VTNAESKVEFLVLGPLEARLDGGQLPLGGAKQRAVLAVLLLHAGEPVPVERLIDEVWGDDPPPSARHSVEAYVSRLRQLFMGHGPALVRRGRGYELELGEATLDAQAFAALAREVELAVDSLDLARVTALAADAMELWRGPVLSDVTLSSAGRVAAEQLEELRLHTLEQRFDAELTRGRHREIVGELHALVGQNPYRERFVEQLMLALYRSGRQADALEVYERTRAALSDDLGLRPSEGLQQLSAQIVRQEPQLRQPTPHGLELGASRSRVRGRTRRLADAVLAGLLVAAVMALSASGSAPDLEVAAPPTSDASRVALVLPQSPDTALGEPRVRDTAKAFRESVAAWGYESQILVVDPSAGTNGHVGRQLAAGGFRLVLVLADDATAQALVPAVRMLPGTRFVFIDASLAELSLQGVRNATGMPYAEQQTSQLMGYLSALVPPLGGRPAERADVVSIVASTHTARVQRLVRAFERGARRALPRVLVRVDFADDEGDKTACERLANDQIDAGSDVVFAVAGACSSPVLAVAKARGVWGIRTNDDGVPGGPHILATTYKHWERAVTEALLGLEWGTLPEGGDRELGLADDYAVDSFGSDSPAAHAAWSKVVRLCSKIREHSERGTS
jgi:DNA-binding SARP family transcriptional activator/basic membrane lipoprotein Med (substrate-binding protein (PBP1-ABC) superfamily)